MAKLIGTTDIRESDADDIAQILRMHVAEKAAKHDPARSSLRTFIERIVANKVRDYLDARFAEGRDERRVAASLDEVRQDEEGGEDPLGALIDVEEALRRAGLQPWPVDQALIIDVRMVLDELSEIDRGTCAALAATKSLREAARDLGVHVETLRQRVARIRAEFAGRQVGGMPQPDKTGTRPVKGDEANQP